AVSDGTRSTAAHARIGALRTALDRVATAAPAGLQADEVTEWGRRLCAALSQLPGHVDRPAALRRRLRDLADPSDRLADGMQWRFLFDRKRGVFATGFRLADGDEPGRLDASHYDLLASEARLASFLAIARGEVPQEHWFRLSRALVAVEGCTTLVSWSGS